MKHLLKILTTGSVFFMACQTVQAADMSECELLLVQVIQIENEAREAQIATYRSATNFMNSVTDNAAGHITQVDGLDIRAIMCRRNEVIPKTTDYAVMSTGIPFILSQNFDSSDTDSLTMYWKDGKIEHVYKGHPLSEEAEGILEKRLMDFYERGLSASAQEAADIKVKIKARMQARLAKEQDAASQAENLVTLSGDEGDVTEVINTASPKVTEKIEMDEIGKDIIQDIESSEIVTSEAMKLNIQTKDESIE